MIYEIIGKIVVWVFIIVFGFLFITITPELMKWVIDWARVKNEKDKWIIKRIKDLINFIFWIILIGFVGLLGYFIWSVL